MASESTTSGVPSIQEPAVCSDSMDTISPSPTPSAGSSISISEDDAPTTRARLARPKMGSRKSSGSMIVPRDTADIVVDEAYDQGDVRTMSPRRSSEEVDRLGEAARQDLIEQAKMLQNSLQAIVDRVESVKSEHEKLEGGNKFLQSYIGELMQTSKITSSAPPKKSRGRSGK